MRTDNLDVSMSLASGIDDRYKLWYKTLAQRNLNLVKNKTAHTMFSYEGGDMGVWHIPSKVLIYPKLVELLNKHYPGKVYKNGVDIGCGTVSFFDHLPVEQTLLIELCEEYCEFMKGLGYNIQQGDIEALTLKDKSMDIVVCSDIFEHVLSLDNALSEVKRVLKDDGVVVGNIPWKQVLGTVTVEEFSHIRTFNESNLYERFKEWKIIADEVIPSVRGWIPTLNFVMKKA